MKNKAEPIVECSGVGVIGNIWSGSEISGYLGLPKIVFQDVHKFDAPLPRCERQEVQYKV